MEKTIRLEMFPLYTKVMVELRELEPEQTLFMKIHKPTGKVTVKEVVDWPIDTVVQELTKGTKPRAKLIGVRA